MIKYIKELYRRENDNDKSRNKRNKENDTK